MNFLQENWLWISTNPWSVAGFALICISIGWGAATLLYQERIALLKERQATSTKETSLSTAFIYPPVGRHGKNILANSTNDIFIQEWLSFRAEVPPKSRLHIELQGPKPEHLDDTGPSWVFGISIINWTANGYDEASGGRQSFLAEDGIADLKLQFIRSGNVQITAFEGISQTPSWTKTLRVLAKLKIT